MWKHRNKEVNSIPNGKIGFIYQITNLTNGKKYIGRKLCITTKKLSPLKGKTRRRHIQVETDWRFYTGSNDTLNADIKNGDKIEKVILRWCSNKNQMNYYEAKEILKTDAIIKDTYYNGWLKVTISKNGF